MALRFAATSFSLDGKFIFTARRVKYRLKNGKLAHARRQIHFYRETRTAFVFSERTDAPAPAKRQTPASAFLLTAFRADQPRHAGRNTLADPFRIPR